MARSLVGIAECVTNQLSATMAGDIRSVLSVAGVKCVTMAGKGASAENAMDICSVCILGPSGFAKSVTVTSYANTTRGRTHASCAPLISSVNTVLLGIDACNAGQPNCVNTARGRMLVQNAVHSKGVSMVSSRRGVSNATPRSCVNMAIGSTLVKIAEHGSQPEGVSTARHMAHVGHATLCIFVYMIALNNSAACVPLIHFVLRMAPARPNAKNAGLQSRSDI